MRFDLPTWVRHLRSVAGDLPLPGAPLRAGDLEGAVRAACLAPAGGDGDGDGGHGDDGGHGVDGGHGDEDARTHPRSSAAPGSPPVATPGGRTIAGEIALWWARRDPSVDVEAVLAAVAPARRPADPGPAGSDGSLLPRDRYHAIEVWTDADLAAMHALWWLAEERGRADWAARLDAVRAWHLANTQPDNATNRPWAIHVFLLAGSPEDEHYAQTLLHNALAMEAEPTPLGRVLLHDAADALERRLAAPSPGATD